MNSTYLTVETILREAELDESYTTNPPNTRVNSPLSLPVGVHDHFQIEAVLQGYYPSMPAPPTNTRDCSPSRDASVHSIQPHTTGQVIETMSRLDQLADERGQNKNLGPAGSLAFQFPEMIVKVSKGISAIISSILIPTNAFQRDGIAARFIDNSKNTVSEVTTESNPSASSKPDANMANLVSVTDGSANTSTATKVKFLALYFAANLGLTLYNKYIMLKHSSPYLLTALHCFAGVVGTQFLYSSGAFTIKPLTAIDKLKLTAFSILYTVNIAISNASLDLVTVPFHQVVRAISPVFTVGIYHLFFNTTYTTQTYISLIPVMFGVGLATYGDYNATFYGFFMTLAGAILAAIKTVTTNRMQTSGLRLSALELLYRMSGPALIQSLIMAYYHGEFDPFGLQALALPSPMLFATLAVNGALAFTLNYTSFSANKKAGALTMTVLANVKQVLTVVLAVLLWNLEVSYLNICGILATLAGGAWYSAVELVGQKAEDGYAADAAEEGKGEKA